MVSGSLGVAEVGVGDRSVAPFAYSSGGTLPHESGRQAGPKSDPRWLRTSSSSSPRTDQQEEAKERYKRRLHFGETPFAVLKAALDLRRFLLRGIEGVQQEWLWGCTAVNLKKLMSLWGGVRAQLTETATAGEN